MMVDRFARLWSKLSRDPDFDAPELQAYDASDELLLHTAEPLMQTLDPGQLVVIGDRHGALTLGALSILGARKPRVFQDPLLSERALAANAARVFPDTHPGSLYTSHQLDAALLRDARLVLLQLPRSLAELDEIAQAIARWAAPEVVVLAGGRVKHMSLSMNDVLGRSFAEVSAGLAARKSRVLRASSPLATPEHSEPRFPVWGSDADLSFRLAAYGATFGGATLDDGSRALLHGFTNEGWPAAQRIVDLGCGNGALAVSAALALPTAEVVATDQSAAAVAATRLTGDAAGVGDRIRLYRADGAEAVPDAWADLILLNPPFHTGATVHAGVAQRLIRLCARALAAGGELRLVFNSSLAYRPLVERVIGPTRQVSRDRRFTVISAIRR